MAINKKLIHFKTKAVFDQKLANNELLDTSIVFIKDVKQIWTHGQLYDCALDYDTIVNRLNELEDNDAAQDALITALQSKQDAITGAATTIVSNNLTKSRALISNGSGKVAVSTVTSTELGYLDGVTSSIQTQLNTINNTVATNTAAITANTTTLTAISSNNEVKPAQTDFTGGIRVSNVTSDSKTVTSTNTASRFYGLQRDKDSQGFVNVPWTDTKVTSVGNHYTPSEDSNSELSVDASSSTSASWGATSLVTGVNLQRDAKGHVTGVTVDSIKMPSKPSDTNTTYSFVGGTNGFTVTPSNGSAQTVTVTPSVSKSDVGLGDVQNYNLFNGTGAFKSTIGYPIVNSGITELGHRLDLHNVENSSNDYEISLRFASSGSNTKRILYWPNSAGTLALTSDIPSIPSLSGGASVVSGKYVSGVTVDGHAVTVSQADLPTLSGGSAAEEGKYVSGVTVNGHTVTVSKESLPTIPTSLKNPKALTLQINGATKTTYDGSSAQTFNVDISSALKYCGITTTALTDGATTNPIKINNANHTAEAGCVVFYGDKEFIFNGSAWEEFGYSVDLSGYKTKQTTVSSPSASGSATSFIDTISQDDNGKITVTKKNVNFPAETDPVFSASPASGITSTNISDWNNKLSAITAASGSNINSVGTPKVTASTSGTTTTLTFDYLKGASGTNGAAWYSGTTTPSNSTGVVGDWYINTNTYNIYKKTAASTWTQQCNIKGASGTDGTDGTNGSNGTNGVDGLSMFYCSSSYTSAATAISRSYLTPSASVKVPVVGDLVLTSSGLLFNITSVLSSTVSVTYLTSLKGAKGDTGDDASVTSTNIENALGYTPSAIMWGTSSTAAATSPKVITCADWTLTSGNMIFVTFTAGISSTSRYIQLNVNSTGNKYVYDGVTNSYITAGQLNCDANGTHCFVYDGTRYLLVGANINTSGSSASGTVTSVDTGTGLTGGPITTSGTISLATSGVTAGNYGPTSNASPDHDGTFAVPYFTVDTYGRITAASTRTITLPSAPTSSGGTADGNDKVKMTSYSTSANLPLLCATAASPTSGSTYDTYYNTGVYANLSTKTLNATKMNASSGFFQTSDETLKNFGENVTIDFEALKLIPKKYFTWKDGNDKLEIGTGAQSLQKIYPELVTENEGVLTVAYDKLAVIALAAVDKLHDENKVLEERIERLEEIIKTLV